MIHRLASQSSKSGSHEGPRVRLRPDNQFAVEEISQGILDQRKGEIEQLYEFEKLEINNQSTARTGLPSILWIEHLDTDDIYSTRFHT